MSKHICLFGGSITWGAWDYEKGGWGARLRSYLENNNHNIIVYNCGVSGDTTSSLLKRFNVECEARKPDVIIFSIGMNDSYYYGSKDKPSVPIEKFQDNLQTLIDEAKTFCSNVIFVGLSLVDENKTKPISWATTVYHDQENTILYNNKIREVSEKNNIPFVNILDCLDLNDIADGVHPNSVGHEKIFLRIKDFLLASKFL